MGQQRYLLFVTVCSLVFNYSISEMLMRTSQAKFFPPDAEPPEETVELWMGRTGLPGANNDVTSGSECDVDAWRRGDSGSGRLRALVAALNCLRCQRPLAAGERVTDQCQQAYCDRKCAGIEEMGACREECAQQQRGWSHRSRGSPAAGEGHQRTEWGVGDERVQEEEAEEGLRRAVGVDRQQLLTLQGVDPDPKRSAESSEPSEYNAAARDWGLLNGVGAAAAATMRRGVSSSSLFRHHVKPRSHHHQHHAVNKRYRLGLYDCISSYCGKLSGPDRQLCIVNYCHRSSTLKM